MTTGHVGQLRAQLGLDTTQFATGLRQARTQSQQFSAQLGAGMRALSGSMIGLVGVPLTMGAIAAGARSVVSSLSALGKQARATGLDVEDLQGLLRGFARSSTLSQEQIGRAFETFAANVGQAADGGGPLLDLFDRLGIALRDSNGEMRDQRALLDAVADAIRRARNESERARIAQIAFGEAGRRMADALAAGPQALRAMTAEARAAGQVASRESVARMEELDDQFDAAARRIAQLGQQIVVGWVRIGDAIADALTTSDAERNAAQLAARYQDLEIAAHDAHQVLINLAAAAREAGNERIAELLDRIANQMVSVSMAFARGEISATAFRDVMDTLAGASETAVGSMRNIDGVTLDTASGVVNGLRDLIRQLGREAEIAAAQVAAATMTPARQVESFWDTDEGRFSLNRFAPARSPRPRRAPNDPDFGLPPVADGGSGGGSRDLYQAAVADIRARTQALLAEAAALTDVANSGLAYGDAVEYARVRAELLTAALAEGRADTPELRAEIDALAQAYVRATSDVDALADAMRNQQAQGERGASALTDLFMAAAQGGDAARQAVARLIAEIARIQMMRGFSLLAGSGSGLGRLIGGLGGFLSGKRAQGGPVMAGAAYLVNEHTANSEVFVPSRSGGVLNVAQAQAALRGSAQRQEVLVTVAMDPSTAQLGAFVDRRAAGIAAVTTGAAIRAQDRALSGRVRSLDERGY